MTSKKYNLPSNSKRFTQISAILWTTCKHLYVKYLTQDSIKSKIHAFYMISYFVKITQTFIDSHKLLHPLIIVQRQVYDGVCNEAVSYLTGCPG